LRICVYVLYGFVNDFLNYTDLQGEMLRVKIGGLEKTVNGEW